MTRPSGAREEKLLKKKWICGPALVLGLVLMLAACGADCSTCSELAQKKCKGCMGQKGKVFWAPLFGMPGCPIYICAAGKGYANCGPCADKPCSTWHNLKEPGVSEEDAAAFIRQRLIHLAVFTQGN